MPARPARRRIRFRQPHRGSRFIRGIGGRAAVISITRLINRGLLLISPILLVRLLSVEEFGRYREFLLYASVLATIAAYNVSTSLLRFVAHRPEHRQQFIDQALWMTLGSSIIAVVGAAALDAAFGGALVGHYMLPIALYVLAFVNFDFWEHLWLAQRRTAAVFAYTTGRLIARIVVVVTAAALTSNVQIVIWSLVGLETTRLVISASAWARHRERLQTRLDSGWREQLRFCGPVGAASVLVTLNRSAGSLYVAKLLGPVGLAHYTIGTYIQPILAVLRNSLSDALLPEMSEQQRSQTQPDPLVLWRSVTIAAAVLLVPAAAILGRFADTIVVTLFSTEYRSAVPVFQIYLLVLLREIMDFAVPLRAINRTAPIMYSNLLGIVVNVALLAVLLPIMGLVGAAAAFVVSRTIEGLYLGVQTARAYSIATRELARWGDLGRVALAAAVAGILLYGSFWTDSLGLFGVIAAASCFLLAYGALLLLLRVPEALLMRDRLQRLPRAFHSRI